MKVAAEAVCGLGLNLSCTIIFSSGTGTENSQGMSVMHLERALEIPNGIAGSAITGTLISQGSVRQPTLCCSELKRKAASGEWKGHLPPSGAAGLMET